MRVVAICRDACRAGTFAKFAKRGIARAQSRACARRTLTLALSRKGLAGVGLRLNSRRQSRASARRTLTLALSHKGRGDLSSAIRT